MKRLIAIVVTVAALVVVPSAAAMTIRFEGGVLTASGGEGNLVPRCDRNGVVNVSGLRPGARYDQQINCGRVKEMVMKGFDGVNLIDLSFAKATAFTRLNLVRAYGAGDSDKIVGSKFARNDLFGGSGSDSVTGGNLADRLFGGAGGDRLTGLGGADLLVGGPGGDSLEGGPGRDTERQ